MFEFGIAHNELKCDIAKEHKDKIENGGYNYFPRQDSKIGIYRIPGAKILEVFVPLFAISMFVFAILGSADTFDNYADRCANLSVALLAYIAFMPTYRETMPPTSYVTMGDLVIYLNLIGSMLALLESYIVSREDSGFDEDTRSTISLAFYALCFIFLIVPFIMVFILYMRYRFWLKPRYDKAPQTVKQIAENQDLSKYYHTDIQPGSSCKKEFINAI